MSGKSSFPYRKYDRKSNPNIVKQILDDSELIEMMKETLIQEVRVCPFCRRKLKEESQVKEVR
jgi:hypothetical protein